MPKTFPRMNPEIKALWLEALRSGEYEQGEGWLKQMPDDGPAEYCCLGVLCDLAEKAGIVESREELSGDDTPVARYFGRLVTEYGYSEVTVLPKAVADWADLKVEHPDVLDYTDMLGSNSCGDFGEGSNSLVSLNDNGVPFDEIANIIEQQF